MATQKPKRRLWWILLIPVFLCLCVIGAFALWLVTPVAPMPETEAYLASTDAVEVVSGNWLIFRPKGMNPTTGLIFYPGARIDPGAYAPAAYQIAEAGFLVVIPHMPSNLAVLDSDVAAEVIQRYPTVTYWAVGGHSLGGAMASQYAYDHLDEIDGLVLWASAPPSGEDFTQSQLKVLSIYGSLDSGVENIEASKAQFPDDTSWVRIEGGNHAQFGWYGRQPGDPDATITRENQERIAVDATIEFLALLAP